MLSKRLTILIVFDGFRDVAGVVLGFYITGSPADVLQSSLKKVTKSNQIEKQLVKNIFITTSCRGYFSFCPTGAASTPLTYRDNFCGHLPVCRSRDPQLSADKALIHVLNTDRNSMKQQRQSIRVPMAPNTIAF